MKLILFLSVIVAAAASCRMLHRVPCPIGAPSCACDPTASSCEFDLHVSLLQTFTKYPINGTFIDDLDGHVHYIDDNGRVVSYDGNPYECGYTDAATVDGKTYRPFIAVNGRIPGPTFIVTEGQTVIVNVKNNIQNQGITIHWHGLVLTGVPWMDGVPFIAQCPLSTGGTFRYKFEAQPSGTFWYHSHVAGQRNDGLLGAFIVRENAANAPVYAYVYGLLDFPERHTLILQDWWPQPFLDVFTIANSAGNNFPTTVGELPAIDRPKYMATVIHDGSEHGIIPFYSGLINGKGKHRDVPYSRSRLATFQVDYSKQYRFRVIGGQALYGYKLSIDQHKLTVISSDGSLMQPISDVDYIIVYPGERYDFILNANANPAKYYWIKVKTLELDPKGPPHYSLGNYVRAVLYYSGMKEPSSVDYPKIQSVSPTCTADNPCIVVNCPFNSFPSSYLVKCVNVGDFRLFNPTSYNSLPSDEPTTGQEYFLNFGYSGSEDQLPDNINGRSFMLAPEPLQLQSLFGPIDLTSITCPVKPNTCLDGCRCLNMINIPFGKTVRLVLVNFGNESHSIHLHGYTFFVAQVGYGTYDHGNGYTYATNNALSCQADEMDSDTFDGHRPCTTLHWRKGKRPSVRLSPYTIRKDTVIVPRGAYVIIQFVSTNPGYWFLHCHLDPHHLEGMAMVLNIAEAQHRRPPKEMTSCGDF